MVPYNILGGDVTNFTITGTTIAKANNWRDRARAAALLCAGAKLKSPTIDQAARVCSVPPAQVKKALRRMGVGPRPYCKRAPDAVVEAAVSRTAPTVAVVPGADAARGTVLTGAPSDVTETRPVATGTIGELVAKLAAIIEFETASRAAEGRANGKANDTTRFHL